MQAQGANDVQIVALWCGYKRDDLISRGDTRRTRMLLQLAHSSRKLFRNNYRRLRYLLLSHPIRVSRHPSREPTISHIKSCAVPSVPGFLSAEKERERTGSRSFIRLGNVGWDVVVKGESEMFRSASVGND